MHDVSQNESMMYHKMDVHVQTNVRQFSQKSKQQTTHGKKS